MSKELELQNCSGVFSTGATGAIAPAILRKGLIAPAILHLPYSVIILRFCAMQAKFQHSEKRLRELANNFTDISKGAVSK